MGSAKRELELEEQRQGVATEIALRAKVLKTCPAHSGVVMEGSGNIQEAYRIAAARIKAGRYKELFSSQRALTDAIKEAVNEIALDYCPRCDKD